MLPRDGHSGKPDAQAEQDRFSGRVDAHLINSKLYTNLFPQRCRLTRHGAADREVFTSRLAGLRPVNTAILPFKCYGCIEREC
jgi:hypothetical protein